MPRVGMFPCNSELLQNGLLSSSMIHHHPPSSTIIFQLHPRLHPLHPPFLAINLANPWKLVELTSDHLLAFTIILF